MRTFRYLSPTPSYILMESYLDPTFQHSESGVHDDARTTDHESLRR